MGSWSLALLLWLYPCCLFLCWHFCGRCQYAAAFAGFGGWDAAGAISVESQFRRSVEAVARLGLQPAVHLLDPST